MLDVIRIEKITHLIFERLPNEKYIKRIFRRSELDRLISKCKNLDIYILSNESILERKKKFFRINTSGFKTSVGNYIKSAAITLSAVAMLSPFVGMVSEVSSGYIFLIILALQSIYFSTGPILLSALLSASIYDIFFTIPYGTPSLSSPDDWLQFFYVSRNSVYQYYAGHPIKKTRTTKPQKRTDIKCHVQLFETSQYCQRN